MIIIPPKLKILAGFKPDEDVTMDEVIAALEKKNLRQNAIEISNESDTRSRQAKFQALMNKREQEFPNEFYEDRFGAVTTSKEGEKLLAQMHRAGTDLGNQSSIPAENARSENGAGGRYRTSEEAQQVFLAEVQKLVDKGLSRDMAWATATHAQPGADAYAAWKILAQKEKNLPTLHRMPKDLPAAALAKHAAE